MRSAMMTKTTKRRKSSGAETVEAQFEQALAACVEKVQQDPYILAAILFGSLSHDTVWAKSDIDLMLVGQDDKDLYGKRGERSFSLMENGVNIHAILQPRSSFRKMIEGSVRSSFMHSAFAKSRLLFTRDPTIRELYENVQKLGDFDRQVQLLRSAAWLLPGLYKAQKWLRVKKDANYAFLWLMYCLTPLAQIEVYLNDQIAGREVIAQAMQLKPELFKPIYADLINKARKTPRDIEAALARIEQYLLKRRRALFEPVFEYLASVGHEVSATEIETHFRNHMNVDNVTTVCEWLADQDLILKAATPIRLTTRSRVVLEELAFYYDGEGGGKHR